MPEQLSAPATPFHGWKILALATFSQFVSVGFTVYLIGLYIAPLAAAFDATPGQLGWASSIFMVTASGIGPVLGYWVDRGKVRLLLTLGALSLALGFVALSLAQNLWHAALACVLLIAPGSAMLGVVTAGAMLVQWFERRRGLAMGIAAAGISAGGFSMPPIAAWLFATYDWRVGSLILAGVVALTLLPAAWLIAVSKPSDKGQYPDGDDSPPLSSTHRAQPSQGFGQLLARMDFWWIALTIGAINFSSIMIITYLVPFALERGIDTQASAFMLSVYAGCAFIGKFLAGWLADKIAPRRLLTCIAAAMAAGILPMLLLDGLVFFPLSAGIVGFALGGLMPVWASLIAGNFGPQAFGRVKGAMSMVLTTVAVIPGPLGGYLHDAGGTYALAFDLLFWVLAGGALVSLMIPSGRVARDTAASPTGTANEAVR